MIAVKTMIFCYFLTLMTGVTDNRHDKYDFGKVCRFPNRVMNDNKNDSNCDYVGTSMIQRTLIPIMITFVGIMSVKMKYLSYNFMMITILKDDYDPNYETNMML